MVTTEELERLRLKINSLVNDNLGKCSTSACINRADFKCNSVEFYMSSCGDSGFKACFDEGEPGDLVTTNWILELLKDIGHFEIILEW